MINHFWKKIIILYKDYWWLTPLTIFLCWRLALELIGQWSLNITVPVENLWPNDPYPPLWARWDSGWYSSIVTDGYNLLTDTLSNTAFFPLYPLLWKSLWSISGWPRLETGVLLANLAALAAVIAFYRWAQFKYHQNLATKTITLWLAFPTSLFLISAYSESTFALLLALTLLAVHQRKWSRAAIWACLASATRPVGIMLWPWLLYVWWRNEQPHKPKINFWLILLPPLGLIIFSLYLWQTTGDALAWLHQQSMAQRHLQSPIDLIASYLYILFTGGRYWLIHVGEIASLVFAGWLLKRLWSQNISQALLTLGLLLPPLFTGILTSFPRFVIVALPLFLALAKVNNRYLIFGYYTVAISLLIMAVFNFVTWRWVA